jgi:hypothetical protein
MGAERQPRTAAQAHHRTKARLGRATLLKAADYRALLVDMYLGEAVKAAQGARYVDLAQERRMTPAESLAVIRSSAHHVAGLRDDDAQLLALERSRLTLHGFISVLKDLEAEHTVIPVNAPMLLEHIIEACR